MSTRIYIATPVKALSTAAQQRLVEAGNPAQTRLHVTRDLYVIKPATTKEVATLLGQGVKVEKAGEDSETADLPGVGA